MKMKHTLTCIAAALSLSSCTHICEEYNTPLAPPTKSGPFLRTPPPRFSGAGTLQFPMNGHPSWYEAGATEFYSY